MDDEEAEEEESAIEEMEELYNDKALFQKFFSKLSYKLSKTTVNGDSATVEAEITMTDISDAITKWLEDFFNLTLENAFADEAEQLSEEELEEKSLEMFRNVFENPGDQMKTSSVKIQLKKVDDEWKIDETDEYIDAILGGMFSAMEGLASDIGSGLTDGSGQEDLASAA